MHYARTAYFIRCTIYTRTGDFSRIKRFFFLLFFFTPEFGCCSVVTLRTGIVLIESLNPSLPRKSRTVHPLHVGNNGLKREQNRNNRPIKVSSLRVDSTYHFPPSIWQITLASLHAGGFHYTLQYCVYDHCSGRITQNVEYYAHIATKLL